MRSVRSLSPLGERVGVRGVPAYRWTLTPHPTPLPMGEGADRASFSSVRPTKVRRMISVAGIDLDIFERGQGAPLLYLHGGGGIALDVPFLEQLAQTRRVIAPSHPGFGKSSLPDWLD